MKLVTFVSVDGAARSGALIDDGNQIVDLQAAHMSRWNAPAKALDSVLAIAEGGQNALACAQAEGCRSAGVFGP